MEAAEYTRTDDRNRPPPIEQRRHPNGGLRARQHFTGTSRLMDELENLVVDCWLHGEYSQRRLCQHSRADHLQCIGTATTMSYFYPTLVHGLGYTATKAQYSAY